MPALALDTAVPLFRRLVAALSVALLLLLSVSAVSPALHEHLHGHDADHASPSHVCAVVLFASGLVLATAAIAIAPRTASRDLAPATALSVFFAAPRHLHPPERGPPAC